MNAKEAPPRIPASDDLINAIKKSPAASAIVAYMTRKKKKIVHGQWDHDFSHHAEHSVVLNTAYTLRTVYSKKDADVLRFYFSKNKMPEIEVAADVIGNKGIPEVLKFLDKVNAFQQELEKEVSDMRVFFCEAKMN